jgi:hypothetical protein
VCECGGEMNSKKVSLFLIVSLLFMATISPCAFSMREIPLTFDGVVEITKSNTKNIPLSNVMMPKSADKCLPPGTSPCLIGDVGCCSGICLYSYPGICGWIFVSVKTAPWSSGIEEASYKWRWWYVKVGIRLRNKTLAGI